MITHLEELVRLPSGSSSREPLTLWVPGEEVTFHRLARPQAPRHKWAELLPLMLEERLLGDPADLHCAYAVDDSQQWLDVACVSRATLQRWQLLAGASGPSAARMVPDVLALPIEGDRWSLHVDGQRCLVRTGSNSGFACNLDWLRCMLGDASPVATKLREARASCTGQRTLELSPGLSASPQEVVWGRAPDDSVRIDLLRSDTGAGESAWQWMDRLCLMSASAAIGAAALYATLVVVETRRYDSESALLLALAQQRGGVDHPRWPANPDSGLQVLAGALARALSQCGDCRVTSVEIDSRSVSLRSDDVPKLVLFLRDDQNVKVLGHSRNVLRLGLGPQPMPQQDRLL